MNFKDRIISLPYLSSFISYHFQCECCTVNLAQELANFPVKGYVVF